MITKKKEAKTIEVGLMVPTKKSKSMGVISNTSDPKEEIIRKRAFIIYLNRGVNPGNEDEDWYMAENEIGFSQELSIYYLHLLLVKYLEILAL